ncbi:MAG TPA: hypothetical protein VEW28_02555 [Candidatus Kapabacteria bacterium]|nr:hypothetical protein [Candidatus Kapabacteria bacterium]
MSQPAKKIQKKKAPARRKKEHKRVWDIAHDILSDVPREAWKDVPKDLGKYSDHYLYGDKKQ